MPKLPDLDAPRFSNLFDLARLPYFEVKNARLVLADPKLGPSVDVHTHELARPFVVSGSRCRTVA